MPAPHKGADAAGDGFGVLRRGKKTRARDGALHEMRERHYNGPVTLAQGEASVDVWLTATGRRIARPGLLSWNGRFFAVEPIASGIDLTQPVEIGLPSGGSGLIMVERGVVHAGGAFSAMFRGVGDPPGELTPDEAEPAPEDSTARASRWASGRRRWASR